MSPNENLRNDVFLAIAGHNPQNVYGSGGVPHGVLRNCFHVHGGSLPVQTRSTLRQNVPLSTSFWKVAYILPQKFDRYKDSY